MTDRAALLCLAFLLTLTRLGAQTFDVEPGAGNINQPIVVAEGLADYSVSTIAGLNSPSLEYSPSISADGKGIYFVSDRPGGRGGHDVWAARFDPVALTVEAPYSLGGEVNTSLNEGNLVISADGSFLLFTACNRTDGLGDCDLYIARLVDGEWVDVENLTAVNSIGWDSQPTLSGSGDTLIFTSGRSGALGGSGDSDLWMSIRVDGGEFAEPTQLPAPINTVMKEGSPFLLPGSSTLYFSSMGHPGYGGFDFFRSRLGGDGSWSTPENLGEPFNTAQNERFITGLPDGSLFLFSSERTEPHNQGMLDIFAAVRSPSSITDAIERDDRAATISAVPNPATDRIRLDVATDALTGELVIYTASGVEAMRATIENATSDVDISTLPTGFYFMVLETPDGGSARGTFVRRDD